MNVFDYLCCPKCKGNLEKRENILFCKECDLSYEIKEGIPVLVDMNSLPNHLRGQVDYFEKEKIIEKNGYKIAPWQRSYLERFRKSFGEIDGSLIVDCGSGSGYMSIELARQGANVIACDLTLKGLLRLKEIAKKEKLKGKLTLVCCSAEELPFKDSVVDYFVTNAVLEHLPREKEAIEEIDRVSFSRAGLMIAVPLSYWYLHPFLLPINFIHDKRIGHLRRYSKDDLERKFSNWQLNDVYYTGHFKKVIKVLFNAIFDLFDEDEIEKEDEKKEKVRKWASNTICFFRKKNKVDKKE